MNREPNTLGSIMPAPSNALARCADDKAILGVRVEAIAANAESSSPALVHCVPAFGADSSIVVEHLDEFVGVTVNGEPPPPRSERERDVRAALEVRIVDALPVSWLNGAGDLFLDVERLERLAPLAEPEAK